MQPSPQASRTKVAIILLAFALVLGGALLKITVGSRFVFFYAERYTSIGWWAFAMLFLVIAVAMFNERVKAHLRLRYPTWWVRWLLIYPLSVAIMAAAAVMAPLGWIAALTLATGSSAEPTVGQLISVGDYRLSSKGCDQRGELAVREQTTSICLEGLTVLPVKGNVSVVVSGKQSNFGLLIESLKQQ